MKKNNAHESSSKVIGDQVSYRIDSLSACVYKMVFPINYFD
jgi:hypothetical protein